MKIYRLDDEDGSRLAFRLRGSSRTNNRESFVSGSANEQVEGAMYLLTVLCSRA